MAHNFWLIFSGVFILSHPANPQPMEFWGDSRNRGTFGELTTIEDIARYRRKNTPGLFQD